MKYQSMSVRHVIKILLLLFILSSCNGSKKVEDPPIEVTFLTNDFFGVCFNDFHSKTFDEIVITNNVAYKQFGDSIRSKALNLNCKTATIKPIDFNKYILVGKYTIGGGCSAKYNRQIIVDDINKKFIYEITVTYSGSCFISFISLNWVLIPKKNYEYGVEFRVFK